MLVGVFPGRFGDLLSGQSEPVLLTSAFYWCPNPEVFMVPTLTWPPILTCVLRNPVYKWRSRGAVAQTVKRLQCGRPGFAPWIGKIPRRRKWQSTPVFLPREFHGQRSLAGYSPWGHKLLGHDWATFTFSLQGVKCQFKLFFCIC